MQKNKEALSTTEQKNKVAGVGHIYIKGALDSTEYERIANEVLTFQNHGYSKIFLNIDSPGGDVVGIDVALQAINNSVIPIETIITGVCASAGYWLASQTRNILAMGPNVLVGSVGVLSTLYNTKKYMKSLGIEEWSVISSGSPKKVMQTEEEFIEQEQPLVEGIFDNFVGAVSKGRNIPLDKVLKGFGQGALLMASNALDVGMIDGIFGYPTKNTVFNTEESLKRGISEQDMTPIVESKVKKIEDDEEEERIAANAGRKFYKQPVLNRARLVNVQALETKVPELWSQGIEKGKLGDIPPYYGGDIGSFYSEYKERNTKSQIERIL